MFLEKYIDELYLSQIIEKYNEEYLSLLDEQNFLEIYALLKKYNFYFINDLALSYLEVFEMDVVELNKKLIKLKEKYGERFNIIMGNDLTIFSEIFERYEDE